MQAYAEGYELMAAADAGHDVTERLKSWQQGTVIRSWLLDLLVLALEADPGLDKIVATRRTPARAAGRWRRPSTNAVPMPVITAALFARFASRQDDSPAMKVVAALRNQFGGHARTGRGGRERPPTGGWICRRVSGATGARLGERSDGKTDVRQAPDRRRFPVVAAGRPSLTRASTCSSAPTGRARPTWSRRSATWPRSSSTGSPPTRRWSRAGRAAHGAGGGGLRRPRTAGRGRDHPRPGQRGPGQPLAGAPAPGHSRACVRTVLFAPEDLALVRGDPGERRRFLDDAACVPAAPRWAGCERIRQGAAAALGLLKTARPPGAGETWTLEVWNPIWPPPGRPSSPVDLVPGPWPPTSPRPTRTSPRRRAGGGALPLQGRGGGRDGRRPGGDGPDAHRDDEVTGVAFSPDVAAVASRPRCSPPSAPRRNPSSTGGCAWSDRTATIWSDSGDGPAKGYASHGESWSLALALRLGGFGLLRCDGIEPVLVLDDVFAELDASRRDCLVRLVGDADQVFVTAAVDDDVPSLLEGTRFVVENGTVRDQVAS